MLAAPEFIEAERVDLLDEIEVAAKLQHRMLADRVVRGEECSEFQACHGVSLRAAFVLAWAQGTWPDRARQLPAAMIPRAADAVRGTRELSPKRQWFRCKTPQSAGSRRNLHLGLLRLRERAVFPPEAAMVLTQSDATASLQLSNQRKRELLAHVETNLEQQDSWRQFNAAYHEDDSKFMRFLIPPGKRVLELGCGSGHLLAALQPSYGVGVDFSSKMLAKANALYPDLNFVLGDAEHPATLAAIQGPFDYIVIADTIGTFEDIDGTLRLVHQLCEPSTRVIISYYSHLWEPVLKLAEALNLRSEQPVINYIATVDFLNLLDLANFESIREERRQLLPRRWLGLGPLINKYIAPLPGIRQLCLRTYIVGRPVRQFPDRKFSASILIPCRNERGNIENAILRMPKFGSAQEILFVEGNSSDGTFEECERVRDAYKDSWDIRVLKQDGKGKGDAVRKGFAAATGDVLMILDADLTMPPEALPKYHAVIETGKAEFVNGTRLIYPMEREAMRPLNLIANRFFAYLFSYLVNTRLTDTLCGTKVLLRKDYETLAKERAYFGNFDPFGDFDLIFGAAKQNLKIIETPIHYKARTFGETQISRFRDGWLLLKMVWFAYRKLKAI
jgi:ubiquinone/menaquinone biosynthesis C-methylase UbiE